MADNLHLVANPTRFVYNANGGLFDRNVQSSKCFMLRFLSDACGCFTQDHVYHQLEAQHLNSSPLDGTPAEYPI
ncbi:hypothetical protein [Mesorhizobium sp. M4A.F.Ca.ET.050.02.1.1]|uniref:hypothetical protein n=1 Tax=Mesorhizobium sp. M4A.F.Ca.ET.050.02.1.1 TaxID=2496754 RepID=UPI001FE22D9B|nr:hypothetical protein [Mesorhizobium sp. M4A.F.Ca.ET.050.02.1.1]